MANIVPFGFNSDQLPEFKHGILENTALAGQGVWFTCPAENFDALLDKIQQWYKLRDEVVLIDAGITDKQELGCIIMEWQGYAVDVLFIDILRTEAMIKDYCVYEVQA